MQLPRPIQPDFNPRWCLRGTNMVLQCGDGVCGAAVGMKGEHGRGIEGCMVEGCRLQDDEN